MIRGALVLVAALMFAGNAWADEAYCVKIQDCREVDVSVGKVTGNTFPLDTPATKGDIDAINKRLDEIVCSIARCTGSSSRDFACVIGPRR